MIPGPVWAAVDARLRARGSFTRGAIEVALADAYAVGGDRPTVEDDELHEMVTEMHAHYVTLGLAREDDL